MKNPVRIKFIGNATEEFEKLNKVVGEEKKKGIKNSRKQQLFKSIKKAIELLRQNPQYGIQIKKSLIPKRFPVTNLWKVNLTGYWRMIYTIRGSELDIICFVLDILDHKRYDKLLGYKKK